jgi:hypothetical protein
MEVGHRAAGIHRLRRSGARAVSALRMRVR